MSDPAQPEQAADPRRWFSTRALLITTGDDSAIEGSIRWGCWAITGIWAALMILLATPLPALGDVAPHLEWVLPRPEIGAAIGIGLPLFLVTMASQNVPGLAVLHSQGFRPAPGPIFAVTGAASALIAPFGAHCLNLAALTAALCAGPDAHPDPSRS